MKMKSSVSNNTHLTAVFLVSRYCARQDMIDYSNHNISTFYLLHCLFPTDLIATFIITSPISTHYIVNSLLISDIIVKSLISANYKVNSLLISDVIITSLLNDVHVIIKPLISAHDLRCPAG